MSNFAFIRDSFPTIYENAIAAESFVFSNPRASCFYGRFTLEQAVLWLYQNEPYLKLPYPDPKDNNLGALIHDQAFQDNLKPGLFPKLRIIHKLGNFAVHNQQQITPENALTVVRELFHFLYWLCRYYTPNGKTLGDIKFNENLLKKTPEIPPINEQKLQQLQQKLTITEELKQIAEEKARQTEEELLKTKAQIEEILTANRQVKDTHDYNENLTRKNLIDIFLLEAGWILGVNCRVEYPVNDMPKNVNFTGTGKADYVLFSDNGQPLAVIEAKRTSKDAKEGRNQAKLYADCLEKTFSQRPIIFYTNGYEIYIWDDLRYPERKISGFLKKDELERMIFRRNHAQKLADVTINLNIVNREYQQEAIRRVTEDFEQKKRTALLVMATGTGKTRTAIALIELLIKAGWIKRALFLADRRSLVIQSAGVLRKNLPHCNVANLLDSQVEHLTGTDIIISTYPTLLNDLDLLSEKRRFFGVGHFDLIAVDEAHRSVYRKYRYLFQYFDGLLLGLTATPRAEIERDTYEIFALEKNTPTFEYSLEQAIKDGFLVPPRAIKVPFKFLQMGIKFNELSEEEKQEFEDKFRDDQGNLPIEIDSQALNQWLFNYDTIDQTIGLLMSQGLKIEGGDRLGKTIIFARNHDHAELIVERFNHHYPEYCGKFAQVIDSYDPYAQAILDDFSQADKFPIIGVSVDMLDTGIDIPEVVNLVFFKPVYSYVKFWQMIGRGTRLCPHLFGFNQPKTEFLIFDLCGNFEFFSERFEEKNTTITPSLTTRLFNERLKLSQKLPPNQLQTALLDHLHSQVRSLNENNLFVRPHLQTVEYYHQRENWQNLTPEQIESLQKIASLPSGKELGDRLAKEFDLTCVKLQLSILEKTTNFKNLRDKVQNLMDNLEQKQTIPMIKAKIALISEVRSLHWWEDVTVEMVEEMRLQLRDLIKFIDREKQPVIYTNFEDSLGELQEIDLSTIDHSFSSIQYKKRVEQFIRSQENNLVINKLKRNLPLTETDLDALEQLLFTAEIAENKQRFTEIYGESKSLKQFIRELVGLDRKTAKTAFSKYLEGTTFTATQIKFVEQIVDYLTQRGIMDIGQLYESPFTNFHHDGIEGLFNDQEVDNLIEIIETFNHTVNAVFPDIA